MKKMMIIDMNRGRVEDVEVRVKTDSGIITGFQFKTNDGSAHDIRLGWFDRVKQKLGQKINSDEIEFISIFDIGYKVAFKNSSIMSYNIK